MVKLKAKKPVSTAHATKSARLDHKPMRKRAERTPREESIALTVPKSPIAEQINSKLSPNGHANDETISAKDHLVSPIAPSEMLKSQSGIDLTEKIKELVRLAQEQGYLTYSDINDALPDSVVTPEDLDEIYIKLRNLEVEILHRAQLPNQGSQHLS